MMLILCYILQINDIPQIEKIKIFYCLTLLIK